MTIRVECHGCGRKFQAPKRLTGQQVKCPGCGAPIQVSSSAVTAIEDGPPILVECECKNQFQVEPEAAGGQKTCPTCGQVVNVPCPPCNDTPDESAKSDLDGLLGAEMTDPAAPTDPPPRRKE